MPQPFSNSSSTVSQTEQDEYLNHIPLVDSKQPPKPQHENAAKVQEFHYGTQELLDALPRVWTRSLLYVALGFAVVVLPWSTLSKIDETGSARGRIEPKGATQKLDSPALGTVVAVNVKEGEIVKAGQTLLEIESDVLKTELQQAELKLQSLQNRHANLETLKNQLVLSLNTQQQQNQAQELAKLSEVEQERQNLDSLKNAYNLQKMKNWLKSTK